MPAEHDSNQPIQMPYNETAGQLANDAIAEEGGRIGDREWLCWYWYFVAKIYHQTIDSLTKEIYYLKLRDENSTTAIETLTTLSRSKRSHTPRHWV